jgi:hypothetical protein
MCDPLTTAYIHKILGLAVDRIIAIREKQRSLNLFFLLAPKNEPGLNQEQQNKTARIYLEFLQGVGISGGSSYTPSSNIMGKKLRKQFGKQNQMAPTI